MAMGRWSLGRRWLPGPLNGCFSGGGVELRQAGIDAPILLLGYTDPAQVPALCRYNLIPSVFDLEVAHRMSAELVRQGSITGAY